MNYLNLHTDLLRSVDYLGAEPVERATWLNLLAWCVSQENGGIIPGAADWGDRKWQQLCGVTLEEAHLESALYHFDDDGNMVVHHYPAEKLAEVQAKREGGRQGGRATTPAKQKAVRENGKKGGRPPKNLSLNQSSNQTERKGKERKGREGEREGLEGKNASGVIAFPLPPSDSDFVLSALREIFPHAPDKLTAAEEADLATWCDDLAHLEPDDAEALVCWFCLVDDRTRGRKRWPRSRAEFLANYAEAMEKIRDWWKLTGADWFAAYQARQRRKAAKLEAVPSQPDPDEEQMTPAEMIEFLKTK